MTAERGLEEVEVLDGEGVREQRRSAMESVPAHQVFDGVERLLLDRRIDRLDEAGRDDVQRGHGRESLALEKLLPVVAGREGLELVDLQDVVAKRRIAHLNPAQGALGQSGLNAQHIGSLRGGLLGRVVQQLEHLDHVGDILLANLLAAVVVVQIVVAIRESEPALTRGENLLARIHLVLEDIDVEEERPGEPAVGLQVQRGKLLLVGKRGDGVEFRLDRLWAKLIRQIGVHAGGEVVAVFGLQGCLRRLGRGLQLKIQKVVVAIAQLVELTPANLVRRNRVGLLPAAAGVLGKVHAGIHREVNGRGVETNLLLGR